MRAIPATLKTKLLDQFKAEGLNNEPRIRIIAKQTTGHTLLTEPIHEDISAASGDVTVRHLDGESEPSMAYAICIDSGIAQIYTRDFPSDENHPWRHKWSLGEALDAAIEFNGTWEMDASKEWYFLRTEQYPYIFFTDLESELYVQYWMDSSTRTHLASGVSNISACRGWQSTDDPVIDQGLIIGYLRDGKVYYRALCYEESGETLWETEREVGELGEDNVSLTVFRTNDFRVGFLVGKGDGTMKMVLTGRSYAGQSVMPEAAVAWVKSDSAQLTATPILYFKVYESEGYAGGYPFDEGFYLGNFMAAQTCKPTGYERTSSTTFTVTFDHELWLRKPLENYLTVTRASASGNIVGNVSVSGNIMYVTTSVEMPGSEQITVSLSEHSNLLFYGTNTSPQPVSTFSLIMDATVYYLADDESATARVNNISLTSTHIDYSETSQKDEGAVKYTVLSPVLTPTQVGDVPI